MSWRDDRRQHINAAIVDLVAAVAILQPAFFGDVQSDATIDQADRKISEATASLARARVAVDKAKGRAQ